MGGSINLIFSIFTIMGQLVLYSYYLNRSEVLVINEDGIHYTSTSFLNKKYRNSYSWPDILHVDTYAPRWYLTTMRVYLNDVDQSMHIPIHFLNKRKKTIMGAVEQISGKAK